MTPSEILFSVPGIPRPQGSKRGFVNKKTGRAIVVEQGGQAHKDWRAVIALAAVEAMAGPCPRSSCVDGIDTGSIPKGAADCSKCHGTGLVNNPPFTGPLLCRLTFKLPRPKSHGRKVTFPDHRPDLDKLARAALDALTHVCFVDDGQIVTLNLRKRWAVPGVDPVGVDIRIVKDSENV